MAKSLLLVAATLLLSGVSADFMAVRRLPDFLWTSANCPPEVGNVTDTLCCGSETFCQSLTTESACMSEDNDAAIYCQWNNEKDKCLPVADRRSNVCCQGQEMNACARVFAGQCPEEFQVKKECCSGNYTLTKFSFLKTDNDDELICCNAPCKAMEEANCPLTDKCAPTVRSFGMGHPYKVYGFYQDYAYPIDHQFGTILHGTGFGRDRYRSRHRKHPRRGGYKKDRHGYKDDDYDDYKDYYYSKDEHVDEITVDDLFLMMIDSMEKDTDVKIYDADITSDPYLGKTKSGGLFVDHNLPDSHKILDEIYGRPSYYDHYNYPFYGYIQPELHYQVPYHAYQQYPTHQPYPMHETYPTHQPYPAQETYQPHESYPTHEPYPTHEIYPTHGPYPTHEPYPAHPTYPTTHGAYSTHQPIQGYGYQTPYLPNHYSLVGQYDSYGHYSRPEETHDHDSHDRKW